MPLSAYSHAMPQYPVVQRHTENATCAPNIAVLTVRQSVHSLNPSTVLELSKRPTHTFLFHAYGSLAPPCTTHGAMRLTQAIQR